MLHQLAPSMLCNRSKINILHPFSAMLNRRSSSKVSMHAQGAHHVTTSKTPNNIDDFYSILGVRHDAQPQEIKTAYRDLIRLLHPDRVEVRQDDMLTAETATDLCVLVNEIYEVLSDVDRRAEYDELVGHSEAAVNPFLQTGLPRDQVFVDELTCIGCGKCVRWAPNTFEIEASKYGRARVIDQQGNDTETIAVAIEVCPVDCIHFVTVPQLVLLEATLSTMDRIEVCHMQRFQRSAGNVFQESFRAFEQRYGHRFSSTMQSRIDWTFFGQGSKERDETHAEDSADSRRSPKIQRLVDLAVAASRATHRFRSHIRRRSVLQSLEESSTGQLRP